MNAVFQQTIRVDASHIDANGHVNNVTYLQWMQDVAHAHSIAVGYDDAKLEQMNATWFIRSHFVKYHRPAMEGDTLIAYTWPSRARHFNALRKYKFVRQSDGATIASGESDWVYIDRGTGRPRKIEQEMLDRFPMVPAEREP
ncbi:thioesterase family protein [Pelagicoccus sp. SDUM812003]|uniref:acyl-CoA thioesterase n=1 Tax=Pelagicoccus sp. SDUM812003 TaxID=3041267 RepID=UPI00281093EB|nr:thioesterase family protein [Pelagicoccus sp. SDUM812003]MDQ8203243.1 thioesterase family protein [Pelagicoccus sp. SDUM812003]